MVVGGVVDALSFAGLTGVYSATEFVTRGRVFVSARGSGCRSATYFSFFSVAGVSCVRGVGERRLCLRGREVAFVLLGGGVLSCRLSWGDFRRLLGWGLAS